jgi:phenylacetate-CoA ligase
MISHNIKLSYQVEYITIGAENLLLSQVNKIQDAFNVMPYQHYGLSEGIANFSQNKDGEMYVDEDYAAVEFIDEYDSGSYEVIGTSLSNYVMPLLRYRTGDIASVKTTPKGRLITALDGRNEDYVILPNGSKIGRLDHIFKDLVNIKEAQIVQKKLDEITLSIVKNSKYTSEDEKMLRNEALKRLNGIKINIEYTDKIPRSKAGKLRFVVSELNK